MEYKITYYPSSWELFPGIRKYGLAAGRGTIGVDSGTVRLSAPKASLPRYTILLLGMVLLGFLYIKLPVLRALRGIDLGYEFNAGILAVMFFCWVWSVFMVYVFSYLPSKCEFLRVSVLLEKGLVTDVTRNGKKISFSLPDPTQFDLAKPRTVADDRPVKVFLKLKSEDEAIKLEDELRT